MDKNFGFARIIMPVVAFMALVLAPCIAQAAAGDDKIFQEITGKQLVEIMKSEGYSAELDEDEDIVWKIEGSKCLILFYDDNKAIQYYVGFADVDVALEDINAWNQSKRFSRTYKDDDGDPCLELDLDLAGGVTQARIRDWLKTCTTSFKKWHREFIEE